jgi:hypothetical protein
MVYFQIKNLNLGNLLGPWNATGFYIYSMAILNILWTFSKFYAIW